MSPKTCRQPRAMHAARCRLRNLRGEMAGEAVSRRAPRRGHVAAPATPLFHPVTTPPARGGEAATTPASARARALDRLPGTGGRAQPIREDTMSSNDTIATAPAAQPTRTTDETAATAPATHPLRPAAANPGDAVPSPPIAESMPTAGLPAAEADVATWITKEAGNRRIPYDRARLERAIDRVHAEFPQLDIDDYKAGVFGFVERKQAVGADDLVDHMIREAEARVDVTAPEWEFFAARLYLHRLYKRASRNRFYDVAQKYGSYVGLQESLADRNVYSNDILRAYSKEELEEAGRMI